jgi:hypothetical protein
MPSIDFSRIENSLRLRQLDRRNRQRLRQLTQAIAQHAPDPGSGQPVALFRASTGLLRVSQNTAFSLMTSWALRLSGVPVVHFTCEAGMSRCIQGLNHQDYHQPPPCEACIEQAHRTYRRTPAHWFTYQAERQLADHVAGRSIHELRKVFYKNLPLGAIVLPSLRWILRRHHLLDDEPTRFLYREYILSAYRVAQEFAAFLEQVQPRSLVVFNGTFFPEAIARRIARSRGLPVITHEVGMRGLSTFFTYGEATAYPVDMPADFELSAAQNAHLDEYLAQRFQGDFTMAGIRFWPEMKGLDKTFLKRIESFRQVVPIFTNVVFDTSQVHANTVFPHMFAWLDTLLEVIYAHPNTFFILRAHPDELRQHKVSQESVRAWAQENGINELPNAAFIDGDEYLSSYELIQRSKFVIVYNSSIGLEAALLRATVVCGGTARYSNYPIALLPESPLSFREQVDEFLAADTIQTPPEFRENARRFLYYQLYRASIPLEDYLTPHIRPGFVVFKDFPWKALDPAIAEPLHIIVEGILDGRPFIMPGQDPG